MADNVTPAPIDPQAAALVGLLRQGLLAVGVLLAGHGVIGPNNTITPDNWQFIVGVLVTLAPVAWSWWEKFAVAKNAKDRETIAVQATLNLVSKGAALAMDGSRVPATPLLPATPASAQDIIAVYAPTQSDLLNAKSLASAKGTT